MRNDVDISAMPALTQAEASLDCAAYVNSRAVVPEMVRLRELEREAAAARTVYESFLQRGSRTSPTKAPLTPRRRN
jgi:hypothetical protein